MEYQLAEIFPPFGLELRCGEVVLAGTRPEHIPDLIEVVRDGILDPALPQPFLVDWTGKPNQELMRWQHFWRKCGTFTPDSWTLMLSVVLDGRAIGYQEAVNDGGFLQTRCLETGSWLGLKYQGRGIGTRIRQMAAMFCFDYLGAQELTSSYIDGNVKSSGVSRRLGYVDNGTCRLPDGDGYRVGRHVILTPDALVRPTDQLEVTGVEPFRSFIGLGEEGRVPGTSSSVSGLPHG